MLQFRIEYEKLHNVLKQSHDSEIRLMSKCRELNAELVTATAKVAGFLVFVLSISVLNNCFSHHARHTRGWVHRSVSQKWNRWCMEESARVSRAGGWASNGHWQAQGYLIECLDDDFITDSCFPVVGNRWYERQAWLKFEIICGSCNAFYFNQSSIFLISFSYAEFWDQRTHGC